MDTVLLDILDTLLMQWDTELEYSECASRGPKRKWSAVPRVNDDADVAM
jgi:hypothetical protein